MKRIFGTENAEQYRKLIKDIENLQWSSVSHLTFIAAYKLLRAKYNQIMKKEDQVMRAKLDYFFEYLESVWIQSEENLWYEGANPYRVSTNVALSLATKSILGDISRLTLSTVVRRISQAGR